MSAPFGANSSAAINLDDAAARIFVPPVVNDPARLAALASYDVLDTGSEKGFEDAVRLTARLCATPVALVSLVTADRQWFKARAGFPACETDLERSVCKFVLSEPDVLVIPDLTVDPRTAANPLVTGEPHIRFYAGAPLRMPDGHALGSLCVIDTVPRPHGLTPEQTEDLRILADQVVMQLELRRAVLQRDQIVDLQRNELRRARRIDVLAKASQALLTASDPAAVLDPILSGNAHILGFDRSYTYDVWPDGRHLRMTHSLNSSTEVRESLQKMPWGTPLCGIIAETRRPLVLTGVQNHTEPTYQVARAEGIDAYAGFPIVSRGALRGVISFASTQTPAFDAEALSFFETITRMMSAVYERLDGEKALRDSEQHLSALVTAGAHVVYRMSPDWQEMRALDGTGFLADMSAPSVRWLETYIEPADRPEVLAAIDVAIRSKNNFELEHRVRRADGTLGWTHSRAVPIFDDAGVITEWFGAASDVTERKRFEAQQAALLMLGDRLRETDDATVMAYATAEILARELRATRAGYGTVDIASESVLIEEDWSAPGFLSVKGLHHFSDYGTFLNDLKRNELVTIANVTDDQRTSHGAAALESLDVRSLAIVPLVEHGVLVALFFVHHDRPYAFSEEDYDFIRKVADRTRAAIARVRAESERDILTRELSHRLKNTLAMVLSIATQTLRAVPDQEPVEAFEKRVHALASAHDILLRQDWTSAPLVTVARAVLANIAPASRFKLEGPAVTLGSRAAMSVSLLLHELATNAAKYGALSNETGQVNLIWRLEGDGDRSEAVFHWSESGGPPVAPPARRGFGSRLIRMGLVGTGATKRDYEPAGFKAELRAPIAQLRQS